MTDEAAHSFSRSMAGSIITIAQASPSALDGILSLLSAADLPHDGVAEHLAGFVIAKEAAGNIIGCIGLERYGKLGLLRSAAVRPDFRGQLIGTRLTYAILDLAVEWGVTEVVLLTTTAKDFFAKHFGFREVARAKYEQQLAASPEWNLPRCSSAVLMSLELKKINK